MIQASQSLHVAHLNTLLSWLFLSDHMLSIIHLCKSYFLQISFTDKILLFWHPLTLHCTGIRSCCPVLNCNGPHYHLFWFTAFPANHCNYCSHSTAIQVTSTLVHWLLRACVCTVLWWLLLSLLWSAVHLASFLGCAKHLPLVLWCAQCLHSLLWCTIALAFQFRGRHARTPLFRGGHATALQFRGRHATVLQIRGCHATAQHPADVTTIRLQFALASTAAWTLLLAQRSATSETCAANLRVARKLPQFMARTCGHLPPPSAQKFVQLLQIFWRTCGKTSAAICVSIGSSARRFFSKRQFCRFLSHCICSFATIFVFRRSSRRSSPICLQIFNICRLRLRGRRVHRSISPSRHLAISLAFNPSSVVHHTLKNLPNLRPYVRHLRSFGPHNYCQNCHFLLAPTLRNHCNARAASGSLLCTLGRTTAKRTQETRQTQRE